MKGDIMKIMMSLESRCRMKISAPASQEALTKLEKFGFSEQILELYRITDGTEINIPGTVFLTADEIIANYNKKEEITIGYLNFGDIISFNSTNGKLIQIDHETGENFLEWDTLADFLNDELEALS